MAGHKISSSGNSLGLYYRCDGTDNVGLYLQNIFLSSSQTAEPLVPDPSPIEVEIATAKLKRFKSPGSDEIPEELIQVGGEILRSTIHKLIKSIWNKEELPDQWKESIIVPVHKKGDKTDCSNYHGNFIQYSSLKVKSIYR
jgi:hypothetical protein